MTNMQPNPTPEHLSEEDEDLVLVEPFRTSIPEEPVSEKEMYALLTLLKPLISLETILTSLIQRSSYGAVECKMQSLNLPNAPTREAIWNYIMLLQSEVLGDNTGKQGFCSQTDSFMYEYLTADATETMQLVYAKISTLSDLLNRQTKVILKLKKWHEEVYREIGIAYANDPNSVTEQLKTSSQGFYTIQDLNSIVNDLRLCRNYTLDRIRLLFGVLSTYSKSISGNDKPEVVMPNLIKLLQSVFKANGEVETLFKAFKLASDEDSYNESAVTSILLKPEEDAINEQLNRMRNQK